MTMDFRCDFEAAQVAFDVGAFIRNCNKQTCNVLVEVEEPRLLLTDGHPLLEPLQD